ncbi:endodeoxyribonuclease, partial [Ceratobasidium sp. 423]
MFRSALEKVKKLSPGRDPPDSPGVGIPRTPGGRARDKPPIPHRLNTYGEPSVLDDDIQMVLPSTPSPKPSPGTHSKPSPSLLGRAIAHLTSRSPKQKQVTPPSTPLGRVAKSVQGLFASRSPRKEATTTAYAPTPARQQSGTQTLLPPAIIITSERAAPPHSSNRDTLAIRDAPFPRSDGRSFDLSEISAGYFGDATVANDRIHPHRSDTAPETLSSAVNVVSPNKLGGQFDYADPPQTGTAGHTPRPDRLTEPPVSTTFKKQTDSPRLSSTPKARSSPVLIEIEDDEEVTEDERFGDGDDFARGFKVESVPDTAPVHTPDILGDNHPSGFDTKNIHAPNEKHAMRGLETWLAAFSTSLVSSPDKPPMMEYRAMGGGLWDGSHLVNTTNTETIARFATIINGLHHNVRNGKRPNPRGFYYTLREALDAIGSPKLVDKYVNNVTLTTAISRDDFNIWPFAASYWWGTGLSVEMVDGVIPGSDIRHTEIPNAAQMRKAFLGNDVEYVLFIESEELARELAPFLIPKGYVIIVSKGYADRNLRRLGNLLEEYDDRVVFGMIVDYNAAGLHIFYNIWLGGKATVHENRFFSMRSLRLIGPFEDDVRNVPEKYKEDVLELHMSMLDNIIDTPGGPEEYRHHAIAMKKNGFAVQVQNLGTQGVFDMVTTVMARFRGELALKGRPPRPDLRIEDLKPVHNPESLPTTKFMVQDAGPGRPDDVTCWIKIGENVCGDRELVAHRGHGITTYPLEGFGRELSMSVPEIEQFLEAHSKAIGHLATALENMEAVAARSEHKPTKDLIEGNLKHLSSMAEVMIHFVTNQEESKPITFLDCAKVHYLLVKLLSADLYCDIPCSV